MPPDLPLPISPDNGCFLPATGTYPGVEPYDPWTAIQLQKDYDDSTPMADRYGSPIYSQAHTLVAEWGGMPVPVRDYQDRSAAVLFSRRQMSYHDSSGPSGQYMGPHNTAWEFGAGTPQTDYWSTVMLGGGQ